MKSKPFTARCEYCHAEFQAQRTSALYCSRNCRQLAYHHRLRNENLQRERNDYSYTNESEAKLLETINELQNEIYRLNKLYSVEKPKEIDPIEQMREQLREEFRQEQIQTAILNANKAVVKFINEVLNYDSKGEVSYSDLKSKAREITYHLENLFKDVPKEYPYRSFLANELRPTLERILDNNLVKTTFEKIPFALDSSFKQKLMDLRQTVK